MPKFTKEQESAIYENGNNIIVSAGAGSGKTAVLTQRVVEKLKSGIHINELLILTFTNAAAQEMKSRIRGKIKSDESLKSELKLLDSCYITTFDSYSLSVVKKYHYLVNLPKDIKICDEAVEKIVSKKIFDEYFDSLYLKNDLSFEKFILEFCQKNDKVLRKSIYDLALKINNLLDPIKYINDLKENYFTDNNKNNFLNDFDNLINFKIKEILDVFLNKELKLLEKIDLPSVPKGSSQEAKDKKGYLKKLCDDLVLLKNLDFTFYGTKEYSYIILDIIKNFIEYLNNYKFINKLFSFMDIERYAIKIVRENIDVANELKDSFKEIMIDEYQDTNDIQEDFISLISNHNVYMVGDIKQSIYGFRGSKPDIFKDKYVKYQKNIDGIKIDLNKNFRSRKEVLKGINDIFNLIMSLDIGGANYKESHNMTYGLTLYDEKKDNKDYSLEVLEYEENDEYKNEEIEIFTIAQDIKKRINSNSLVFDKDLNDLRKISYKDFAIILDRSNHFELIKKIFEYENIPVQIYRDGKLNDDIILSLIKNMLTLVIKINEKTFDEEFKYAFMSVGRSFLYEYDDNYLFNIISKKLYKNTSLYEGFKKIDNINSNGSYKILNDILDIVNIYEKIYKVGSYEDINAKIVKLLNIVGSLNDLGYTIKDVINYIDNINEYGYEIPYIIPSVSSESVKIMTIHKSKGLEYPICYFMDLDHEFNKEKDSFILSEKYGILFSLKDGSDKNFLKVLNDFNEKQNTISEKIRLFYVALTRAREKIIIVIPSKEKSIIPLEDLLIKNCYRKSISSISDIIYFVKPYLKKYYKQVKKVILSKNYLYQKEIAIIIDSNDNLIVKNNNIDFELIEENKFSKSLNEVIDQNTFDKLNLGLKVHEYLEYANLSEESDNIYVNNFKKYIDLNNILNVYHEYEFRYKDDNNYHGVIDLMIEYEDKICIYDFKLKNTDDDAYKKQLDGYRKYVERKTNKKIYTYLYSILDNKLIELKK